MIFSSIFSDDLCETFKNRIQLYKLRADVNLEDLPDTIISTSWSESTKNASALRDLRFPDTAKVLRLYNTSASTKIEGDFDQQRIKYGVAESGSDYQVSNIFPHDIYFDLNNAIDFKKGCYVGQEVISRIQHRSSARKRVVWYKPIVIFPQMR